MELANRLDQRGLMTTRYHGLRAVLQTPDFRRLWLGVVCSQIGMGMQQVLLGWLVLAMTDSSGMVGTLFAVRSAPNLLVGFAAGTITDRLDRRLLMRGAVGGCALTAWLLAYLLRMDQLQVWQLLLCTAVLGALQAFDVTARQVYVYDLLGVRAAAQGIAVVSFAQRSGGVLGSLLAGVTLEWWGPGPSFLLMGSSYAMGTCALAWLRHRGEAAPTEREPLWHNLRSYLRALRTNQALRSLILSTAVAETFGFSHQVMLPVLAKDVFQVGAAGLGVLTAFRFLGGTLGVGLCAVMGDVRRRGRLLLVVLVLFGCGEVVLSQVPSFWLAVLCITFINIMAATTDILHHTLLQFSVANEQRGRAMGAWIVGIGMAPFGQLEVGHLAGLTTARLALLVNGVGLIAVTVALALCRPRLRQL
jgi:MFS family permease